MEKIPEIRSRRPLILSAIALGAAVAVAARRRTRSQDSPPAEPRGELRDLWAQVDGLRIYARVSVDPPAGLPVVLVPGYGMSSSYLAPIARRLAAERPVYAPDLPGHGRSEDPEKTLTVPELAESLRAWMDEVGIGRAAFLGNSLGCQILAELAARHPERVDRLILICPTVDATARSFLPHLPRLLRTALFEPVSLLLVIAVDYSRAGLRRLLQELDVMFGDRIEDKLARIAAPALVVHGERDALVPSRWAEEVDQRLGSRGVRVIRRGGHAPNYSAPDELMRAIRPFLSEATAG